jgi:regulator of protease activity HflC (stomatin/prohibitin superfamily)
VKTFYLALVVSALIGITGCGQVVPPGKQVILLHPNGSTEIHDKGVYKAWGRTQAYFVDQKLQSFPERMNILCKDEINLENVDIKTILSFDASKENIQFIKEKVPAVKNVDLGGKELSLDRFYEMTVGDIVRGTARNVISQHTTEQVRPNRQRLETEIQQGVTERIAALGYPLTVSAVLISNIDYPAEVTAQRKAIKNAQLEDEKQAALAEAQLADQKRQVAVEQEKAKVRLIKAQAQADENAILTESLTPEFLQWRQYEVMENTAKVLGEGASNTVFMMPYQTMTPDTLNTAVLKSALSKK